jgi:hypothetical protein
MKYVSIWCTFTLIVTLASFHEHHTALFLFYIWDVMQLIFYGALWLMPLNRLYRRPAGRVDLLHCSYFSNLIHCFYSTFQLTLMPVFGSGFEYWKLRSIVYVSFVHYILNYTLYIELSCNCGVQFCLI